MASIAIVGNLLVLLGRYWYRTRSNLEHSMYLRHLAASDLLMGIYLAIIAIADMRFRGQYIFHDELWRYSGVCAFSGMYKSKVNSWHIKTMGGACNHHQLVAKIFLYISDGIWIISPDYIDNNQKWHFQFGAFLHVYRAICTNFTSF